ncbi:MAG: hypothetical protein J0L64_18025 [Acidobacteria bacterium]|nr:hypothetical protein [Acidobacteriota bacterium]
MRFLILLLTAASLMAAPQTFTGIITDDMCKMGHTAMNMGPDPECVRKCVREMGSKYALYDGKKVYKLSDQKLPEPFAGKKVVVKGKLYEKTGIIKVESIEAAK